MPIPQNIADNFRQLKNEIKSANGDIEKVYNHDKTKSKYLAKRAIIDLISKVFILVAIGMLTVDTFKELNYAKLIWGAVQVAMYLMLSILSYLRNHDFVVDDLRGQKIKRINLLNECYDDGRKQGQYPFPRPNKPFQSDC